MVQEGEEKNRAVKATVTFADGHTQDFDVFVVVGAEGIIATFKKDDKICYSAPEDGFTTVILTSIAADIPVIAGLLEGMSSGMTAILDSLDPMGILEMLKVSAALGTRETTVYKNTESIRKNPNEN